jgi:asparagine synthase (glutamine-hydrolysing)
MERPVLRTAPAPLYLLSGLVRRHGFKVVITGEGADEVFGGYDLFKEAAVRRFWARRPQSAWRAALLRRLYPYLGAMQSQSQAYLRAFFRNGLERADDPLFSHLPRFLLTQRAQRLLSAELLEALRGYDPMAELREQLPAEFRRWHPLSQAQYLETAYLLPGYILSSQGDRVSMAHAVEGRFPFLDHRVVEFAARIAPRMKLRGLREKHVLRRALGPLLPAQVVERPKQPYRAPDAESFFGAAPAAWAEDALSEAALREAGCFDPRATRLLVAKCRAGTGVGAADGMALVGILSTQLLHRHFVARVTAPARGAAPLAVV